MFSIASEMYEEAQAEIKRLQTEVIRLQAEVMRLSVENQQLRQVPNQNYFPPRPYTID